MKRKVILFITASTLCFTSAFAITGKGYRIISEQTYSTPGFNGHVEHVTPGTAEALKKTPAEEQLQEFQQKVEK